MNNIKAVVFDMDGVLRIGNQIIPGADNVLVKLQQNNIKTMIDAAASWEEGEMKNALIFTIANHMKKSFLSWNKDTVEDAVIFDHLFELSNGKIDIRNTEKQLTESSQLLKMQRKTTNYKKQYKKNNNRNRKRY